MKRGSATAVVLVLALLAQAAAAFGRAPCMMASQAPTPPHAAYQHSSGDPDGSVAMASDGRHTTHHHAAAQARVDPAGHDPHGDCCHGLMTMDCAAGGCAAGAGTMLSLSTPVIGSATVARQMPPEPGWLPPYLSPTATIYRPPIA